MLGAARMLKKILPRLKAQKRLANAKLRNLGKRLVGIDAKLKNAVGLGGMWEESGQILFMKKLFAKHSLFAQDKAALANNKKWSYGPARAEISQEMKKALFGDFAPLGPQFLGIFGKGGHATAEELVGLLERKGYTAPVEASWQIVRIISERAKALHYANDNIRNIYSVKKARYTRNGRVPTQREQNELTVLANCFDGIGHEISVYSGASWILLEQFTGG